MHVTLNVWNPPCASLTAWQAQASSCNGATWPKGPQMPGVKRMPHHVMLLAPDQHIVRSEQCLCVVCRHWLTCAIGCSPRHAAHRSSNSRATRRSSANPWAPCSSSASCYELAIQGVPPHKFAFVCLQISPALRALLPSAGEHTRACPAPDPLPPTLLRPMEWVVRRVLTVDALPLVYRLTPMLRGRLVQARTTTPCICASGR